MHEIDPNAAASADGIFGLPHTPEEAAVVLVPVPFDATTSYRPGTAAGPAAILEASAQIDLYDHETGNPWKAGIAMVPPVPGVAEANAEARPLVESLHEAEDADALARVNALCGQVNDRVTTEVGRWLAAGKLVGMVGGDHATAYGSIQAHARHLGEFGILHIDAHADLRQDYEGFSWSHASIMEAVVRLIPEVTSLVQVGIRDYCEEEKERIAASAGRIRTHFDADLCSRRFAGEGWADQVQDIIAGLPERVYVSFDIDGLDPRLCPHTGTPVPGGLDFQQAAYLIGATVRSGRQIIGFDLVEVAPGPDGDEWDGNVGARMLYKLIGWALESRPADKA